MAFSQPWSDKPSIRLTPFEVGAITAIALLVFGFIGLLIAVLRDALK